MKHFEREVVDRDQEMLLAITDHSPEQMQRSTPAQAEARVEGLVILESEIETRLYETMLHDRVPLVPLNRLTLEPGVSDVAVDATSAGGQRIAEAREGSCCSGRRVRRSLAFRVSSLMEAIQLVLSSLNVSVATLAATLGTAVAMGLASPSAVGQSSFARIAVVGDAGWIRAF